MAKKSYYELLQHPKWQKKRLRILEDRGFCCEWCSSEDDTLHVHHGYYAKGKKPWDYPDSTLHVYCRKCHRQVEGLMAEIRETIGALKIHGLDELLGILRAYELWNRASGEISVDTYGQAVGAAHFFGVEPDDICGACDSYNMLSLEAALSLMREKGSSLADGGYFSFLCRQLSAASSDA